MIINSSAAKIGVSINSRSERHGEDNVPAMDIPLGSIMLQKHELCELMRDATIWDRWFNQRSDGLPEPANANLKPFGILDKYDNCTATIRVGLHDRAFGFEDCTLSKMRLTPCVGGLTELQVTLQALIDDTNTALFEFMSKDCTVELSFGKLEQQKKNANRQPELPLVASNVVPMRPDA